MTTHPTTIDGVQIEGVGPDGEALLTASTCTSLTSGRLVRVAEHPLERELLGVTGALLGFTKPHGFAAVQTPQGRRLTVHPEALTAEPRAVELCSTGKVHLASEISGLVRIRHRVVFRERETGKTHTDLHTHPQGPKSHHTLCGKAFDDVRAPTKDPVHWDRCRGCFK